MGTFILLSVISIALSLMLAWYIWKHMNKGKKHTYFILLMLSVTVWSFFAALEVVCRPKELKILFSQLSYIGIVSVPVFWLYFSIEYSEKFNWLRKRQIKYFWVIPAITLCLVFTNSFHGLIWSHIYYEGIIQGILIYKYERGFWFLINMSYIYLLFFAGLLIIFISLKKAKKLKDYFPVILGALAPLATNAFYIVRVLELDYSPAAFSFTCICLAWAIITGFLEKKMAVAEVIHRNMEEGIILIDEYNHITNMNPYAGKIIGFEDVRENAEAEKYIFFWDELKDKLIQEANEYFEISVGKNSGIKWYGIHLYAVNKESNISGWLVSLFDITEKKNNEEALRQMDREARKAAEAANVAKSYFLANMSHEIRTPMNGILGFVDILSQTPMTREQYDYLNEIRNASDSLLYMINDVLDFSKIEADKMELENTNFNLHKVIENALTLIAPGAFSKGIGLHFEIKDGVPEMVKGDPGRLRQVFNNLLGNALKFTHGGEISVTAECIEMDGDKAVIKFAFSDTGIGMKEEALNNIFKPFTQADSSTTRKYGGTGLGLAICKRIIEMMGGTISVESAENKGTVFTLQIGFEAGNETEGVNHAEISGMKLAARHTNMEEASRERKSVLLAEDTEANRKLASIMLKKIGFDCEVVVNGKEAVEACEKKQYNIILMDCQMPVMDGREATKRIKDDNGLNAQTPVIAMTANALEGDREKCIQAGMDDFISKPINLKVLEETIKKWL